MKLKLYVTTPASIFAEMFYFFFHDFYKKCKENWSVDPDVITGKPIYRHAQA